VHFWCKSPYGVLLKDLVKLSLFVKIWKTLHFVSFLNFGLPDLSYFRLPYTLSVTYPVAAYPLNVTVMAAEKKVVVTAAPPPPKKTKQKRSEKKDHRLPHSKIVLAWFPCVQVSLALT